MNWIEKVIYIGKNRLNYFNNSHGNLHFNQPKINNYTSRPLCVDASHLLVIH